MGDLPTELHEAMARLLDADAESERSPTPLSSVARLERLRTARAVIAAWRTGEMGLDAALGRLEGLVTPAK